MIKTCIECIDCKKVGGRFMCVRYGWPVSLWYDTACRKFVDMMAVSRAIAGDISVTVNEIVEVWSDDTSLAMRI